MMTGPENSLGLSEVVRVFQPDDLDVDDLATAIRQLLDSGDPANSEEIFQANSPLHSFGNRASHVMGLGAAEPS